VEIITHLCPLNQGHHGFTEFFSLGSQGIFNTGRNLREGFPMNQTLPPEILQNVGKRFRTDSIEAFHDVVEPDFFIVPDDGDDEYRPFLRDGVDDPFERTKAYPVTIGNHSYSITINLILLILS
jgi:hypothetical protein